MTDRAFPVHATIEYHLAVPVTQSTSFSDLKSRLCREFRIEPSCPLKIRYRDTDGDLITVSSDDELAEARSVFEDFQTAEFLVECRNAAPVREMSLARPLSAVTPIVPVLPTLNDEPAKRLDELGSTAAAYIHDLESLARDFFGYLRTVADETRAAPKPAAAAAATQADVPARCDAAAETHTADVPSVAERIDAFAATLPDSIGRLREGELALTALRDLAAVLREPLRPAMSDTGVVVDVPALEVASTIVAAADECAAMPIAPTSHASSLSIALATDSHTPSDAEEHTALQPASAAPAAAGVSLGDVTVPAGMEVVAGTAFTKRWRVLNAGPAGWPAGSVLVPLSGVFTAASTLSAPLGPGGETDVAVPLVAPDRAGPAAGAWMLYGPDGQALLREPLHVDIEVVDAPAPAPLRRSVLGRSALAGSGAALSSSLAALVAPTTPPAAAAPVASPALASGEAADEWEMVPAGARSGPATPPAGLPVVFDADALAASLATPHDPAPAAPAESEAPATESALPDEVAASLAAELGREIARLQTEIERAEQAQRERMAAAVGDAPDLVEDGAVISAPAAASAPAPAAEPAEPTEPVVVIAPIPTLAAAPVAAAVEVAPAPVTRTPSALPPPPPVPIVLASAAPPAVPAVPFGVQFAPAALPPPLLYPQPSVLPPAPPVAAPSAAVPPPLPARPRAGQFWLPDAPPADMPAWMRSPFAAPDAPAPAPAPAPVPQQQQQTQAPHGRRNSHPKLLPGEERFAHMLTVLDEMGFRDRPRNLALLRRTNNVEDVIDQLVRSS